MANTPYRATITITGVPAFQAISAHVSTSTLKDQSGSPVMGSMLTAVKVWVDMHDDTNMPNSSLTTLHDMAQSPGTANIVAMQINFWKDDTHQDALCTYNFQGWISKFETSHPMPDNSPQTTSSTVTPYSTLNHLLYMELEPSRNTANAKNITMGN